MDVLKDLVIVCVDCNEDFILFVREQRFFIKIRDEKRKENPNADFHLPKRCPACRELRKQKKTDRDKMHKIKIRQQEKLDAVKNIVDTGDDSTVKEQTEVKVTSTANSEINDLKATNSDEHPISKDKKDDENGRDTE